MSLKFIGKYETSGAGFQPSERIFRAAGSNATSGPFTHDFTRAENLGYGDRFEFYNHQCAGSWKLSGAGDAVELTYDTCKQSCDETPTAKNLKDVSADELQKLQSGQVSFAPLTLKIDSQGTGQLIIKDCTFTASS